MKKILVVSSVLFVLAMVLLYASAGRDTGGVRVNPVKKELSSSTFNIDTNFGKIPLYFIPNRGQVNPEARFYAKTRKYTLWMTAKGLVFDRYLGCGADKAPLHREVSRLNFLKANKRPGMIPVDKTGHVVSYFKGNRPSQWRTGIATSKAVLYRELYEHIDLKVYGIANRIEYDWMVRPGGKPGRIRFNYENVNGTHIDKEGNLVVETEFGRLVHRRPVSYQEIDGKRVPVDVTFKGLRGGGFGFNVGVYNRRHVLIIDPVVVAYSTYLGGTDCATVGHDVALLSGCAYVVGYTCSEDFPVVNRYKIETSGGGSLHGDYDVTVTKFSSGGDELVYSSFLGGLGSEYGTSIAVDSAGGAYITGYTSSYDYPFTYYSGPWMYLEFQHQGGVWDAIVTRFSPDGTNLLYSSYLGGDDAGIGGASDYGLGIAVDSNECAYICGLTYGRYFPVLNEAQGWIDTADSFGFITKLDTTLDKDNTLIYSTYVRGTDGESVCYDIALSGTNAFVAGATTSTDFDVTGGAYQTVNNGDYDAFALQLSEDGSSYTSNTYIGGTSDDRAYGIVLNGSTPFIVGATSSTDFPTLNPYQATNAGGRDVFITRFAAGLNSLSYSTYLGGSGTDVGLSIGLAATTQAVVTGTTTSSDYDVYDPLQTLFGGGSSDAFVSRLAGDGSSLLASTYLGGDGQDEGSGIAASGGTVCVVGYTASDDFLIYNAYDNQNIAVGSAFVTKFTGFTGGTPYLVVTAPSGGEVWPSGTTRTIKWGRASSVGDVTIEYSTDNGSSWNLITPATSNDGAYDWDVPSDPSTECLVRVSEASDNDPSAVSESTFTIFEGFVVTSPNGGENWEVGTDHPVTWESSGSLGDVRLELSTDNGASWSYIIDSTDNDGSHLWTVSDSVSTQCLVRVSEATDGDPVDESNSTFSIIALGADSLTLTYPNGGENLSGGDVESITWESTGTGVPDVRLEYSTDGGTNWETIIASTTNDGSYSWTVPSTPSTTCLVRVSDATDGDPVSQSNAVFTILEDPRVPEITLTYPNGGNTFRILTRVNITWTSVGDISNVHIELSSDGGTIWSDIAASTTNSGTYSWTVPSEPSTQCLVRVSDADDGDPTDVSDAVFTIETPPPSVTITSPVGGEYLKVGTVHDITWISFQVVGDIKIEYSTDDKGTWSTIVGSTDNDGSHSWTVPNKPSSMCYVRLSEAVDGSPSSVSPNPFTITTGEVGPGIALDRTALYFGSLMLTDAKTPPQKIMVSNSGIGTLKWMAVNTEQWLHIDSAAGTENGVITVSVNPWGVEPGTYTDTITVSDSQDEESYKEVAVTFIVYPARSDSAPIGGFDSPVHGSTVRSSVPVTGWALDDIEVERVSIWREGTKAEGGGKFLIGDAILVEGARPDVEPLYPTYPRNYKAGWGYMMLTHFLPGGGNGSYTLYAYAHDGGGHETYLGSKTITCDNANAVKPFGAIDTPAQGGEVYGARYRNNGWVLTPMPNKIPTNGSTITIYIDGVPVGNPAYGYAREDVAALFPDYANSTGPHGYSYLDTTTFANGVHTISWAAVDNAGNSDGIGSRYFISVQNTGYGNSTGKAAGKAAGTISSDHKSFGLLSQLDKVPTAKAKPVDLVTGYGKTVKPVSLVPAKDGRVRVKMKEDGRIELRLARGSKGYRYTGYLAAGKELRALPVGSSLDAGKGIFYWQTGMAFLGKYELLFIGTDVNGKMFKLPVTVTIDPKFK